jgi:hypothetical protein
MGRTACIEPQCLYSRATPLLPLWAVRPVQSLSACKKVHFTLPFTLKSSGIGRHLINTDVSEKTVTSELRPAEHLWPHDRCSRFIRNTVTHLPSYIAIHSRRDTKYINKKKHSGQLSPYSHELMKLYWVWTPSCTQPHEWNFIIQYAGLEYQTKHICSFR